jgi:hypothetical protein
MAQDAQHAWLLLSQSLAHIFSFGSGTLSPRVTGNGITCTIADPKGWNIWVRVFKFCLTLLKIIQSKTSAQSNRPL